ncbi:MULTISPECIES: Lon protease family protein [unclassified Imperialibacter]|uniref:Lon protease family protein n=1 Tax=unclassified Imperialibacter TaxID=2629706 RepID=UPI0012598E75|nr:MULTISPECIES: ATP-binding protein [unclassified Imperialibacter]CAD5265408.1 Endopeptidase La [Imperialibacter sp. 89]CAD5270260.1 Endopeptidase La [Imperialibacter sp. 75]VVT09885.1 Endopeptidase La [Imperialibacter sp. EC-SDR9]
MKTELPFEAVRKKCKPSSIKKLLAKSTASGDVIIGQERAAKALKFGLGIKANGFNIFVSGIQGTGKLTTVKNYIDGPAKKESPPNDWCYVNNFQDPYQPTKLPLPSGKAVEFKTDMKILVQDVHQTLVKAFEKEDFINRKGKIIDAFTLRQKNLFKDINERAAKESILIEETPVDIVTVPLKNGKPMTDNQFNKLSEEKRREIRKKQDRYIDEIKKLIREARRFQKETNEALEKLEKEAASFAIGSLIEEIEEKYEALPQVMQHLKNIKEDILANLPGFIGYEKPDEEIALEPFLNNNFVKKYEVNILVDNGTTAGSPVVIELNPTYNNLFGRVEKESQMGTWLTDLTLIRKGSLHQANGGYLIIQVEDLFKNLFSWESLKRALKNKEIVIEEAGDQWGFITTKTLKPEPIPLNVKVVLLGDPLYYHLLYTNDSDFKELFKVKADFDVLIPRNDQSMSDYIGFCNRLSQKEGLSFLNDEALAKMIEHGSRLAGDQNKLSTVFSEVSDVIREANYYASVEGSAKHIGGPHIQKAIEEKVYRSALVRDHINEMIANKQLLIDHKGKKVGQVNALSVIQLGDTEFGIPNRITCSSNLGKDGVMAIEKEAELSGPIHTKGVMILSGYLAEKYSQNKPVSLDARIVFEQMYAEIEGDSASSSELYAILSSLSGVPIRQGIAVTGSVNQKGQIQAIGGVNEKIEGYFEVCKILGFNEEQGVIIPASNVRNLMLREEVQEAIRKNKFKVWAVDTIDEGMEILTGLKAEPMETKGTLSYLVNKKLNDYANRMKAFSDNGEQVTN